MGYIYALNLFESKISIGLYRHEVEALVFDRKDPIKTIKSLAVNAKVAVMGMNAYTQTDSSKVVLSLPSHFNYYDKEHVLTSLKDEGLSVCRILSNTEALALYYYSVCSDDKTILVIINDGTGYSIGVYELGGGVVEALYEYHFCHNPRIVDWTFLKAVTNITKFFYVGEEDEVYSHLREIVGLYIVAKPETVPSSWIINGCTTYSAILMGCNTGMVLLQIMTDTISIMSEKTYMIPLCDIGITIPFSKTIVITTTSENQEMLFVEVYRRRFMQRCALKQSNEIPVQAYWVYGIKECKKGEARVEVRIDCLSNIRLSIRFFDPETKVELHAVPSEKVGSEMFSMTTEQLELYRPALYYEKDV